MNKEIRTYNIRIEDSIYSQLKLIQTLKTGADIEDLIHTLVDEGSIDWIDNLKKISYAKLVDDTTAGPDELTQLERKAELRNLGLRYLAFHYPNKTDDIEFFVEHVEEVTESERPVGNFWQMMYDHDSLKIFFDLYLSEKLTIGHIRSGISKFTQDVYALLNCYQFPPEVVQEYIDEQEQQNGIVWEWQFETIYLAGTDMFEYIRVAYPHLLSK